MVLLEPDGCFAHGGAAAAVFPGKILFAESVSRWMNTSDDIALQRLVHALTQRVRGNLPDRGVAPPQTRVFPLRCPRDIFFSFQLVHATSRLEVEPSYRL